MKRDLARALYTSAAELLWEKVIPKTASFVKLLQVSLKLRSMLFSFENLITTKYLNFRANNMQYYALHSLRDLFGK